MGYLLLAKAVVGPWCEPSPASAWAACSLFLSSNFTQGFGLAADSPLGSSDASGAFLNAAHLDTGAAGASSAFSTSLWFLNERLTREVKLASIERGR